MKNILIFVFILGLALNCHSHSAQAQDLGSANVEVIGVEKLIFDLSEDDALIATCSAILLVVGKTETASWFATILDQKMITDFLFDVISLGLEDGDFTNEELNEASASCIVVMEKSKRSFTLPKVYTPRPSAPPPGAR